jgi:hypothetical protein
MPVHFLKVLVKDIWKTGFRSSLSQKLKICRPFQDLLNKSNLRMQRGNRLRESLPTFITLHKARAVYHWEVVADTKLFQDSSLENSVCTSRCRTKLEKTLFFSWPPMPLEIELLPWR